MAERTGCSQPLLFFLLGNNLKGVQRVSHSTDSIAKKCSTIEWVGFLFHRLDRHSYRETDRQSGDCPVHCGAVWGRAMAHHPSSAQNPDFGV